QISGRPAVGPLLAFAGNPDQLTFVNTERNTHAKIFRDGFSGLTILPAKGNRSHRALQSFVQRDHDIAFDIVSARGAGAAAFALLTRELLKIETLIAAPAEELLEKVTETGPTEMKFVLLTSLPRASAKRLPCPFPARRRFRTVPVCAERIVFLALGRIAQD